MPPSTTPVSSPAPVLLEGAHAITASSSGNSDTLNSLHNVAVSESLGRNPQNFNSVSTAYESLDASPSVLVSPSQAQIDAQPFGQLENLSIPHSPQSLNPSVPPQRVHQMTTRSMNQIFKPKQLNSVSKHPLPQTIEPTSVGCVY